MDCSGDYVLDSFGSGDPLRREADFDEISITRRRSGRRGDASSSLLIIILKFKIKKWKLATSTKPYILTQRSLTMERGGSMSSIYRYDDLANNS